MLEDPKDTGLAKVDIDPMVSLDAEQEFIFLDGPSRAGEDLQSRTRVDDIREKRGRRRGALTFFRTRSEYTRRDLRPVSPGWATFAVPDRAHSRVGAQERSSNSFALLSFAAR